MRSRTRRRSISSFVSPGPRPPMPPASRESESSLWASRGSRYLSWASSTWSLPSALCARWAKMSRMSWVRSSTLRLVSSAMCRLCDGLRSWSKTRRSAIELHRAQVQLLELAAADEVARVRLAAHLQHRVQHLDAGGARQLARARRATPPRRRAARPGDRHQHGPLAARDLARGGALRELVLQRAQGGGQVGLRVRAPRAASRCASSSPSPFAGTRCPKCSTPGQPVRAHADGGHQVQPEQREVGQVVAGERLGLEVGVHQPQAAEAHLAGAGAADVGELELVGVARPRPARPRPCG